MTENFTGKNDMNQEKIQAFLKKYANNTLVFGLIFPALIILAGISWLIFHQSNPQILNIVFRVLKGIVLVVLIPKIYELIAKRNRKARYFLIIAGLIYALLVLFLAAITIGAWIIFITTLHKLLSLGLALFLSALTAFSARNLYRQIQIYRGKIKSDTEK